MKLYKLFPLFILFCNSIISQTQIFHDTQGKLEISNSGQATYTLPIALPPSIQDVGPTINLLYVSGQSGGIAGQGWSINSISAISRIATRNDIDGYIDGVDFDENDKLALDGQRLLLKSGSYWSKCSTYETEIQSNTKIELKGTPTAMYFVVTYPDGSRSWYGNYGGMNAVDLTSFYITRFEDANGNFITYKYNLTSPNNNGTLSSANTITIDEINFSANINGNPTPLNKIKFTYKLLSKIEKAYLKGVEVRKIDLLDKIEVFTNNLLFRKYQLTHFPADEYGYVRVEKVQEFNGNLEAATPVIFEYDKTIQNFVVEKDSYLYNDTNTGFELGKISGDLNGDGKVDMIWDNKFFGGQALSSVNTLPFTSDVKKTFFVKTVIDNKLNQKRSSLLNIVENTNTLDFNIYASPSPNSNEFPYFKFTKTINSDNLEKEYLNGDFNGDGITETLIINHDYYTLINSPLDYGNPNAGTRVEQTKYYMLDLNPTSSTTEGEKGFVKINNLSYNVIEDDKKYIQDFNGDGKDDILIIKSNHSYKVISFNQLTTAPWVTTEIIGQGSFYFSFHEDRALLFGDFNGDGKIDMMHPNVTGVGCEDEAYCSIWYTYYSNPKTNKGDFFEIESQSITNYMPQRNYDTQTFFNDYLAIDTNKDGKTDLVRIEKRSYSSTFFFDLNPNDNARNSFRVSTFVKTQDGFVNDYNSPTYSDGIANGNVAYPVAFNQKINNIDYDLVMY